MYIKASCMAAMKRLEELASKWLDGTITPEEKTEFAAWYNAEPDGPLELPETFARDEAALKSRILANVRKRTVKRLRTRRAIAVAASVILAAAIGTSLWYVRTSVTTPTSLALQADVQPGGSRAMLTLADGRIIDLSSEKKRIIIDDEITYEDGSLVATSQQSVEISTPKGGQYQLTLPDGTTVWLNSETTLRYPATFKQERREVELVTGEAYFDVVPQPVPDGGSGKPPFIVRTDQQEVQVLGTRFNINAYADEPGITTTLVEGRVNLLDPRVDNGRPIPLAPGRQAQVGKDGLTIREINTEEITAWKEGYFYFNDASIYEVMKQLERWYDIHVDYHLTHSDDLFVGKIPRDVSLTAALSVLRTAGVRFEIEGRTLTVLPKP